MVMASDAVAIRAAIQTTGVTDPAARAWRDSRHPVARRAAGHLPVEVEGSPEPLAFDDAGDLPGLNGA